MILAIFASLFGAAMNAGSSVLQRLVTDNIGHHQLLGRRQAVVNFVKGKFLFGMGLQVGAFGMQALALSQAPLIVVEPLLTTDLIFLLLFLRFTVSIEVKPRDWAAVALMIAGMTTLFLTARPRGGYLEYALLPWIICAAAGAALIAAGLAVVKTARSSQVRAAAASLAAAVSFALNAAFTKLALNQLSSGGVVTVFSSWPLCALAVSGLLSIYLLQTAYSSGPLAISQPIMEVAEPSFSVVIGIMIFGESVNHGVVALALEIAGTLLVVAGIVGLSTSPQIQRAGERGM